MRAMSTAFKLLGKPRGSCASPGGRAMVFSVDLTFEMQLVRPGGFLLRNTNTLL